MAVITLNIVKFSKSNQTINNLLPFSYLFNGYVFCLFVIICLIVLYKNLISVHVTIKYFLLKFMYKKNQFTTLKTKYTRDREENKNP